MKSFEINHIQITPIPVVNGLVAFASCELFNSFHIGNIAIYTAPHSLLGYRLVFPTKKLATGKQVACFYPFTKEAEIALSEPIIKKYTELMKEIC